ncbi:unnamed protein product, partial [Mesorhabditis spiculigera]
MISRLLSTEAQALRRIWRPGEAFLTRSLGTRAIASMNALVEKLDNVVYARQMRNADRVRNGQKIKNQRKDQENKEEGKESSSGGDGKESDEKDGKFRLTNAGKILFISAPLVLYIIDRVFFGDDSTAEVMEWYKFIDQVLPARAVREIILFPEKELAFVHIWPDAKSLNGERLKSVYRMTVPSNSRLEAEVRAKEQLSNLPPESWTPIRYKRMDEINMMFALATVAVIGAVFYFIIRGFRFSMGNMMKDMGGNQKLNIIDPHSPEGKKALKIKFKDVAGCHEAKVEIKEFVDYLKNSSRFTRLGAKLPKGALLTGPPGCGKTLLAKALAAESTVPFISMNGTEFVEMIGGLGASRIRSLFKSAKERAPCIIYIDEIDAIGKKRSEAGGGGMGGGSSEEEQTLNQLLVEMDGMDSAKGVVVLASTNRADVLDKALLRRGRFDRHISIDLPTVAERKEMFELYLRQIKTDFPPTQYSERLAQMTPGFSGADIRNAVNESAIKAATDGLKKVTVKQMEYAMDKIIAGPAKRSRTLVKEERDVVAYHEAGHALVGWMLEHTDALLKVTIIPRTSAALGFAQYCPRDKKLYTKEEMFERMCMMLGGRAAEMVKFGRITTGAQNDLEKVTHSALSQVKNYGFSAVIGPLSFSAQDERAASFQNKPYSKKLQATIDQEASMIVGAAYKATDKLIKDNVDKLELIAQNLLKHEVLSYEDVKRLIGPPPHGDKQVIDIVENALPKDEP